MGDRVRGGEPEGPYRCRQYSGELRKGVEHKRKSDSAIADQLSAWVDGLEQDFAARIIAMDAPVARLWGELSADRSRPVIDTLIAATALTHDLTLVTRNAKDLEGIEVIVLDPFSPSTTPTRL